MPSERPGGTDMTFLSVREVSVQIGKMELIDRISLDIE